MKQKSGAALLILLAVSAILIPLIQKVWLDTQHYYQFRRYSIDRMKARFNAQSGIDISLVRLYTFKGAEKSIPKKGKTQISFLLDQFWSFPFNWPLTADDNLLESEKDRLQELKRRSFLQGSYTVVIKPEDGRFDLNDLSSPLPFLQKFTYAGLFGLLSLQIEADESLKNKYDESDIREILNNISDWVDLDNESRNGGLENAVKEGFLALNRSFISIEELKKVPGVEADLYQLLEPYITVYGAKSLNINYTKDKILSALGLPPDTVEQIMLRITADSEYYQPFSSKKEFCDFSLGQGYDLCEGLIQSYGASDMLSFDFPTAFRIISQGRHRAQKVELEVLLYDLSAVSLNYQKRIYLEEQRRKNESQEARDSPETPQDEVLESNQEELKFDYSYHKPLVIMYMKENHRDL